MAGRRGKQPDGSIVWSSWRPNVGNNLPVCDSDSVSYSAAIESACTKDTDKVLSVFAQRVEREARRREFHQAECQVIIGDGARWIWQIAAEMFPNAVQIVDLFHAIEHLWDVAKAIYGPGTGLAAQWARQRQLELDNGQIDAILSALKMHASTTQQVAPCIRQRMQTQHSVCSMVDRLKSCKYHCLTMLHPQQPL